MVPLVVPHDESVTSMMSDKIYDISRDASFGEVIDKEVFYVIYQPPIEGSVVLRILEADVLDLRKRIGICDPIILFGLYRILELASPEQRDKMCFFDPFLFQKLIAGGDEPLEELVARLTERVDIFEKDFVLFPVVHASHFSLLILVRPYLLLQPTVINNNDEWDDDIPLLLSVDSLPGIHGDPIVQQFRNFIDVAYSLKMANPAVSNKGNNFCGLNRLTFGNKLRHVTAKVL
eukprot:scaffold2158_cov412-Ochromonas_danica.AAC.1